MKKLFILVMLLGLLPFTMFAQSEVAPNSASDTATHAPREKIPLLPADMHQMVPEIYTFVDEPPRPKFDLRTFLARNLQYPEDAKDRNIQGRVTIQLVVDEAGAIESAEVIGSVSPSLDAEAMRVAKKLKFKPGKQGGKNVKVYYRLPIIFSLS